VKTGVFGEKFTGIATIVLRAESVSWTADVTTDGVNSSSTDLTSGDSASKVTALKSFTNWFSELLVGVDSGQPETVSRSKVVTSTSAVTFNEWRTSESFQT